MAKNMIIFNKKRAIQKLMLSFMMTLVLVACVGPNDKATDEQKKNKKIALIVFVQSDLDLSNDSDYKIFQSIKNKKIKEVINRNIEECPDITSILICPLCKSTRTVGELGRAERRGTDSYYDKTTLIEDFLLATKNRYRKFLNNSQDNKIQDIIGAYYFLRDHQDVYSDCSEIRVVFISDMIHYLATLDDYDLNTDNITFCSLDCLEAFKKQVNDGKIKTENGYNDLKKIFEGKKFVVWTVKPDLGGARSGGEQTRGYDIDGLWRKFFSKIGATEVKMNM